MTILALCRPQILKSEYQVLKGKNLYRLINEAKGDTIPEERRSVPPLILDRVLSMRTQKVLRLIKESVISVSWIGIHT